MVDTSSLDNPSQSRKQRSPRKFKKKAPGQILRNINQDISHSLDDPSYQNSIDSDNNMDPNMNAGIHGSYKLGTVSSLYEPNSNGGSFDGTLESKR